MAKKVAKTKSVSSLAKPKVTGKPVSGAKIAARKTSAAPKSKAAQPKKAVAAKAKGVVAPKRPLAAVKTSAKTPVAARSKKLPVKAVAKSKAAKPTKAVAKSVAKKVVAAPAKRAVKSLKAVPKVTSKPVVKKLLKKVVVAAKKTVRVVKKDVQRSSKVIRKAAAKVTAKPAPQKVVKSSAVTGKVGPKVASVKENASAKGGRDKNDERARNQMPLKQTTLEKIKAPSAPVRIRVTEESVAPPAPEKKAKLKTEDLKKLRNALLQERERILEEIRTLDEQTLAERIEEGANQQPGFSLQLADSASENLSVETALMIRSTEDEELAKIEDALRAIDSGDYGICHRCHEPISMERLLVKPMARYCVPCLRLLESGKA